MNVDLPTPVVVGRVIDHELNLTVTVEEPVRLVAPLQLTANGVVKVTTPAGLVIATITGPLEMTEGFLEVNYIGHVNIQSTQPVVMQGTINVPSRLMADVGAGNLIQVANSDAGQGVVRYTDANAVIQQDLLVQNDPIVTHQIQLPIQPPLVLGEIKPPENIFSNDTSNHASGGILAITNRTGAIMNVDRQISKDKKAKKTSKKARHDSSQKKK